MLMETSVCGTRTNGMPRRGRGGQGARFQTQINQGVRLSHDQMNWWVEWVTRHMHNIQVSFPNDTWTQSEQLKDMMMWSGSNYKQQILSIIMHQGLPSWSERGFATWILPADLDTLVRDLIAFHRLMRTPPSPRSPRR